MNFNLIKTFCKVTEEGSMTAASKKLHLTQPAVSQQIHQLEGDLKTELVVRSGRELQLTAQGRILYTYGKQILELTARARIAIEATHAEVRGTVRVGTLNSIGLHLIGPVFSLFLKNNSTVQLKLIYGGGSEILQQLDKGELDVAVVPDAASEYGGDPAGLEKELLTEDEMILVCRSIQKNIPNEIKLAELGKFPFVKMSEEYPRFDAALQKSLKATGTSLLPVFESRNAGTLKRVIESGIGWGFLPAHTIRKQLSEGRFQQIRITDFEYRFHLACYRRKEKARTKAVDVFLSALTDLKGEH